MTRDNLIQKLTDRKLKGETSKTRCLCHPRFDREGIARTK